MKNPIATSSEGSGGIKKPWYKRPLRCVAAVCLVMAIFYFLPLRYSDGDVRFMLYQWGTSSAVTFCVQDGKGNPMPGVEVVSESFSGTTSEITDAAGFAVIKPSETEVLAVRIDGQNFRFRPDGFLEYTAPDCFWGVTLNVTISKQT